MGPGGLQGSSILSPRQIKAEADSICVAASRVLGEDSGFPSLKVPRNSAAVAMLGALEGLPREEACPGITVVLALTESF